MCPTSINPHLAGTGTRRIQSSDQCGTAVQGDPCYHPNLDQRLPLTSQLMGNIAKGSVRASFASYSQAKAEQSTVHSNWPRYSCPHLKGDILPSQESPEDARKITCWPEDVMQREESKGGRRSLRQSWLKGTTQWQRQRRSQCRFSHWILKLRLRRHDLKLECSYFRTNIRK